jgi:hypothetical protein
MFGAGYSVVAVLGVDRRLPGYPDCEAYDPDCVVFQPRALAAS